MERETWVATYSIAEPPGFALIDGIHGTEEEAKAYADEQVGTDLKQWGHNYRLLELRGLTKENQ